MIEFYFVFNYLMGNSKYSDCHSLINEYNHTILAESFYSLSFNVELIAILSPQAKAYENNKSID